MALIPEQDLDFESAREAQKRVFTSPGLLEKAQAIANTLYDSNSSSFDIAKEIRKLLVLQGEWDFEQEIKDHQYGVEIAKLDKGLNVSELRDWLNQQFCDQDYILMPKNAMGKYKDHWNWIYFKEKAQAVLFKLTWA